jgi:hypothetical protein
MEAGSDVAEVRVEPTPQLPEGLRRFVDRRRAAPPEERCELCAVPIAHEHSHLVERDTRRLVCACRPCYLVFMPKGASGGRFRCVPERYLHDPAFDLTPAQWDDLQIPVGMAFFFYNSDMGKSVAFYPGPAGATESLLALDSWEAMRETNPLFASIEDDVEALLVRRSGCSERLTPPLSGGHPPTPGTFECYLVPIDACYELVGLVRLHWKGFDGGEEAQAAIAEFFDRLREQSRSLPVASEWSS